MNHYFMCNAIILFNSNCSAGRMLRRVSNHLSAAAAAALSTAGAAKPTPARARPALLLCQEQFQLPQPGLQWGYNFSFPLLPPAVALSPNSVTNSPNSFICHLIQCLFISSCLSFWECVCHTFMYTCFIKEHAKTKFLGALETPHINYSVCIHG